MLSVLVLHTPAYANLNGNEPLPTQATPGAEIPPAHSTTGPRPPLEVQLRDLLKSPADSYATQEQVVLNVPAYLWRHGCGPTSLSMVMGYYDVKGFSDLIAGDAWTQTPAVNQMIASGRDGDATLPVDFKGHYEDYAVPMEPLEWDASPLETDDYITAGRAAHADDSLADYIGTSRSTAGLKYGWSNIGTFGSAFVDYFHRTYPQVDVEWDSYYTAHNTMTWEVLVREIDAGRPMVFLVDSRGDGYTDHFVTVIGYRDSPRRQYASHDTWSRGVRWEDFSPLTIGVPGVPWGIYGGWSYQVTLPPAEIVLSNNQVAEGLPAGAEIGSFSTNFVLLGDAFTYTLVPGSGDADNAAFSISANRLLSNAVFDFDSRSAYTIRVRSSASNGDFTEQSFAIRVVDLDVVWLFLPMVIK